MNPPNTSVGERAQLVLVSDGREYPLGAEPVSVGRELDNRVVVASGQVSPHHCVLWRTESDCFVRDDRSAEGTFLNDHRITGDAAVRDGDVIRIGGHTLTIRASRDVSGPAPQAPVVSGGSPASPVSTEGLARPGRGLGSTAILLLFAATTGLLIILVATIGAPGRAAFPGLAPSAGPSLLPTASGASSPVVLEVFRPILTATVRVMVPADGSSGYIGGSGSVVSSQGHILTNYHVIGTPDTGKLYNSQGRILIAVNTSSLDRAPQILYTAELVKGDTILDLALLKVVSLLNGAPLPSGFSLPWMPIGDSDALEIGDDLTIVGFPGLGDVSVTLTRGTVSGFLADGGVARAWIKTDTEISEGNSGGPAVNDRGELVGIPSRIRVVTDSGKLGYVRPVNLAKPLLSLITP